MDGASGDLYFSVMAVRPPSVVRPRVAPRGAAVVPAFFLYGEPLQAPDERVIHVETIAARSRLHDWVIEPHRHRDLHQVLLTRRGRTDARLDGTARSVRSPAAIVVPPGVVHSFRFQPRTDGFVISFAPGLLQHISATGAGLVEFFERATASTLDRATLEATDLWTLGDMLLREFGRSAPGRHAALRGLVGALLANLLRVAHDEPTAVETASRDRELVARFRQLVERRFREHVAIGRYVGDLQTTETRLRRACLNVTGQSPVELVHLRLIVEAERQLSYTSMPVTQVAYYLGFEDPAYFTRFFTRRMGVSPRTFRTRGGFESTAAS
jgi:AraC family transcriptional activator of pobA